MLARNLERAHRYQIAACIGFYAADRHAHVSTVAGSDGKKQTHHFYMYLIYIWLAMRNHGLPRYFTWNFVTALQVTDAN